MVVSSPYETTSDYPEAEAHHNGGTEDESILAYPRLEHGHEEARSNDDKTFEKIPPYGICLTQL